MSKVKTIKISNFKAISDYEADFKGCTAIVMAGNNMGKTSLLRGIPDRIRFVRPDVMVKEGAMQGKGEMTLTTGEKFVWEFNSKGTDKLTYFSKDNVKENVTVDLGKKFFPAMFDIDKFLQGSPKEQSKQLQKITGLDFADIDARHLKAYNDRTSKNADAEKFHVKLTAMLKVDEVKPVDITALSEARVIEKGRLNQLYLTNKKANEDALKLWEDACKIIDADVKVFNENEATKLTNYNSCKDAFSILKMHGYAGGDVDAWLNGKLGLLNKQKTAADLYTPKPPQPDPMPVGEELEKLDAIEKQIMDASKTNDDARKYKEYIDHKTTTEAAKVLADEADALVKSIEAERNKMIAGANFPKGISITPDGITIDGLPLDRNQISTSKLYCAALRIAAMNLGEVKTLYFDASFLDRNSLAEIEAWANASDLQLLIERPDFEGGEIRYELIENSPEPTADKKTLF